MRFALAVIVVVALAAPSVASDISNTASAPVTRTGAMLRDANNIRVGAVDSVKPDGSVGVIYESHYVVVPGDSLSVVDGKLVTKLTKAELSKM